MLPRVSAQFIALITTVGHTLKPQTPQMVMKDTRSTTSMALSKSGSIGETL